MYFNSNSGDDGDSGCAPKKRKEQSTKYQE